MIVDPDELLEETEFSTTITITTYVVSNFLTATNPIIVPTGGAGLAYRTMLTAGPAFANVTKPAEISGTIGIAKVTPSMNPLLVPSLGLNGSTFATSVGPYGLPGTLESAGSYGLPEISALTDSYGLPKPSTPTGSNTLAKPPTSTGFYNLPQNSTPMSQGTPGIRFPFGEFNKVAVQMLLTAFLTVAGDLISLF